MNISKRERIIITLALLAAVYAGGHYLFSGSARDTEPSAANDIPADEFMMEVDQSLALNRLTETEEAIIEKAGTPWPPQPFVQTDALSPTTGTDAASPAAAPDIFSYTGYIKVGNRHLAIIGGTEYEIGDRITDSQFTIRGISSEQVILEDSESRRYSAPLQDESGDHAASISLQFE